MTKAEMVTVFGTLLADDSEIACERANAQDPTALEIVRARMHGYRIAAKALGLSLDAVDRAEYTIAARRLHAQRETA